MSTVPAPTPERALLSAPAPTPPARLRWRTRRRDALLGLTGILVVLAVWQVGASTGVLDPTYSSSPAGALSSLWDQLVHGDLWGAIGSTLQTIVIGVGLSIVLGIPLGLVVGRTAVLRELIEPWISILYSVPYVVFLPIIIFWFGIGETSRVLLVVWSAIFPLLINVVAAARNLDRRYLAVSTVFCASRVKTLRSIVFPASLPYVLAGIRLAVGRGLVGAIVAELFMGTDGLGYVVQTQTSNFEMDNAMAAIAVIAIIAVVLTRTIGMVEKRYAAWAEA